MTALTRRSLLRIGGGLFASMILTGCVGGTVGSDETTPNRTTTEERVESDTSKEPTTEDVQLEISDRTASPGSGGVITVKGRNIGSMMPSAEQNPISLNFDNVQFSPQIKSIAESYPPYWHWPSPQSQVTVKIPYQIPENIPTGVYEFTITGWHGIYHEDKSISEIFAVAVKENTARNETP